MRACFCREARWVLRKSSSCHVASTSLDTQTSGKERRFQGTFQEQKADEKLMQIHSSVPMFNNDNVNRVKSREKHLAWGMLPGRGERRNSGRAFVLSNCWKRRSFIFMLVLWKKRVLQMSFLTPFDSGLLHKTLEPYVDSTGYEFRSSLGTGFLSETSAGLFIAH